MPACEVKTGTFDQRTTFCRPRISRSSLICVISAICRKRPLFIFLHFFLLNFYFPRVILTIRESREDALKSTELSRDSSRCKARHRNMPGFVGFIYRILSNWFCGCWWFLLFFCASFFLFSLKSLCMCRRCYLGSSLCRYYHWMFRRLCFARCLWANNWFQQI